MSNMVKYDVLRGHEGDRFYHEGETRELPAATAKHLVNLGVLATHDPKRKKKMAMPTEALEARRATLKSEVAELEAKQSTLTSEITAMEAKRAALAVEEDGYNAQIAALRGEIDGLKTEIGKAKAEPPLSNKAEPEPLNKSSK